MAGEVDAYLAARREFVAKHSELANLSKLLRQVWEALNNKPERFMFSNIQPGLPAEASMLRDSVSVDGTEWPSAQRIQELLVKWHQLRGNVRDTWANVPGDDKSALQEPPPATGIRHY